MPPLWSFGTWMSRITYFSEAEGRDVARKLRENKIPSDVIHFDTGWFGVDWQCDYAFAADRFDNPRQFQALFDSLFKVLFIFPSRYLFAIGLSPIFSLGRNLPPDWGCIPKQPDSPTAPRGATGSGHDGALTLSGAPFQGTWARSAAEDASPDYNSDAEWRPILKLGLNPGSLAVTKGILVSFFSSAY